MSPIKIKTFRVLHSYDELPKETQSKDEGFVNTWCVSNAISENNLISVELIVSNVGHMEGYTHTFLLVYK